MDLRNNIRYVYTGCRVKLKAQVRSDCYVKKKIRMIQGERFRTL